MANVAFDYSKLKGRIIEKYDTMQAFSKKVKISSQSLSYKLNNKVDWRQSEISKCMKLLDIPFNEVDIYFFNEIVQ